MMVYVTVMPRKIVQGSVKAMLNMTVQANAQVIMLSMVPGFRARINSHFRDRSSQIFWLGAMKDTLYMYLKGPIYVVILYDILLLLCFLPFEKRFEGRSFGLAENP